MKKEILEVLNKNKVKANNYLPNVIFEQDFEKIANELDTLFAKRIVMHRRELLIAFFESVDAEDMEQQRNGKGWKVVDNYLKAIYSA